MQCKMRAASLFKWTLNLNATLTFRDAFPFQNGWIFGKVPKGGGGHFQSKNLYCKIWTFKQGYLTMKLIQRGLFRLCFSTIVLIKIKTRYIFKKAVRLAPSFEGFVASLKNLQYNFPKMRGGGSKAVWNFSENSSILEGKGVPKVCQLSVD